LVAAGFDPSVDARLLQLFVDGEEVPLLQVAKARGFNANDTLSFYGVELDTPTTDTHTYWLVNGNTAGKRTSPSTPSPRPIRRKFLVSEVSPLLASAAKKLIYSPRLLNGDTDNIFGAIIFTDPTDQTLSVRNIDSESASQPRFGSCLAGPDDPGS